MQLIPLLSVYDIPDSVRELAVEGYFPGRLNNRVQDFNIRDFELWLLRFEDPIRVDGTNWVQQQKVLLGKLGQKSIYMDMNSIQEYRNVQRASARKLEVKMTTKQPMPQNWFAFNPAELQPAPNNGNMAQMQADLQQAQADIQNWLNQAQAVQPPPVAVGVFEDNGQDHDDNNEF